MTTEAANSTSASTSPGPAVIWAIRLLAIAGAGVAGYLLTLSLARWGLPAGCGAGSGCEAVLTSRWSMIFNVPVSAPALLAYFCVLAASLFITCKSPISRQRNAWGLLIILVTAIGAAAIWFIGLQVFVLKAVCPWCMTDHAIGIVLALLVLLKTPLDLTPSDARTTDDSRNATPESARQRPKEVLALMMIGTFAVIGMAAGQWIVKYEPPAVQRLAETKNSDTGPGPNRTLHVLSGKLQVLPNEEPMLGSPDAEKLLVILYDYCCPHCQATHGYLIERLPDYRGQLAVVMLPMPLDSKCNPSIEQTEDRFQDSCELARLALAVWRADRTKFAEFDIWLYESEMPRGPRVARRKAEELVTLAALEKALTDPWIDAQIKRNVEAYASSGRDVIPILMSPGFDTIVGRPESAEKLFETLELELKLRRQP